MTKHVPLNSVSTILAGQRQLSWPVANVRNLAVTYLELNKLSNSAASLYDHLLSPKGVTTAAKEVILMETFYAACSRLLSHIKYLKWRFW